MARINSYTVDNLLSSEDTLMGSSYVGTDGGVNQYETRSYRLEDLTNFFSANINIPTSSSASSEVGENDITTVELDVLGEGNAGQFLVSDGGGGFSWITFLDTNTTYTQGDGGLTEINFTSSLKTKLDGIEASASLDQTDAEIRTAVEAATDSNVFTDADHTKLNAIEASATADQTAPEIRSLVGTGNNGVIPSAGTSGHFLKHDGSFGLPSYTINTNTTYTVQDGELSQNSLTNTLKTNYNTAYTHSQAAHAPAAAEQNVQSDWGEASISDDAYIKNRPELADLDLSAFFAEFTYTSSLLTKIEYWNASTKNTKYYTKDLTYTSGTLTQIVLTNNVSSATQTKVLVYDGSGNLTTITKS